MQPRNLTKEQRIKRGKRLLTKLVLEEMAKRKKSSKKDNINNIKQRLILFTLIILVNSCTTSYYQLYKVGSDKVMDNEKELLYEQSDVKIKYNFWDNYGNSSFLFYNNSDSNIYIDLSKSHLIINGIANTYFRNRLISESASISQSSKKSTTSYYIKNLTSGNINTTAIRFDDNLKSRTNVNFSEYINGKKISSTGESVSSQSYSIGYYEEKIICIPPHSGKVIDGYHISYNLYKDCDLFRYPSSKSIKTITFNKENSPLKIKNIIAYSYNENISKENIRYINNKFWVKEITNYPYGDFYISKQPEFCGEKSLNSKEYFKFFSTNNFFIKYIKDYDYQFKH